MLANCQHSTSYDIIENSLEKKNRSHLDGITLKTKKNSIKLDRFTYKHIKKAVFCYALHVFHCIFWAHFFSVSAYSLLLCLFAATILVISEKLYSQNVKLFHWKGQENLKKIAHSTSDVENVLHSSSDNILRTCNSKVFLYHPFNTAFFFVVVLYETLSVYGFVTPSNQLYLIVDFSASFVFIRPEIMRRCLADLLFICNNCSFNAIVNVPRRLDDASAKMFDSRQKCLKNLLKIYAILGL